MLYQLAAKAATWTASIPAADPTPPPGSNPFSGWVGKPDPSWLGDMRSAVQGLSGMALGAAVVVAILVFVGGAALFIFAGKDKERKQGGVRILMNVLQGLGLILIGIPVLVLLIGAALRLWPS